MPMMRERGGQIDEAGIVLMMEEKGWQRKMSVTIPMGRDRNRHRKARWRILRIQ